MRQQFINMESALQQVMKQISNLGNNVRNTALDLPYKIANAKNSFNKAIQPNVPFSWDTGRPPQPQRQTLSNFSFDLSNNRPTGSAKMAPYMLGPESDMTKQQVADYLKSYGVRPAAIEYFSQIPVKQGADYVSGGDNVLGTSYQRPNFIGLKPNAPPGVLMHEYMHQVPRTINPKSKLSSIITKMFYPDIEKSNQEFTNRWGENYMKRPGALQEEQFAERRYPNFYYSHVLEPRPVKKSFKTKFRQPLEGRSAMNPLPRN